MKILVTAEQFGYGPIATGLNVVKELKKYPNVELTFMGTGIALEQAKMSNYFDEIIECKTYDEKELEQQKEHFFKHDIILSSENIPGARYALKLGLKNVYYMDNLMWMWDKLEEGLENLRGYIISEIIPCKQNFERIGKSIKNSIFVGPIRNIELNNQQLSKTRKLIINVGGAEAFIIDSKIVISFYNKLINEVLSVDELNDFFEKITICGGSGVINNLKIRNHNEKIVVKTLSNEEYLTELNSCSHCIMASGLGNFVETVWRNKEILYLPPINYSQLLQLDHYKKMNLGFDIINWSDFKFYKEVPCLLNEKTGVNLVIDNVKKYIKLENDTTIQSKVKNFLSNNQDDFYEERIKYTKNLKANASKEIAEMIYSKNKKGE